MYDVAIDSSNVCRDTSLGRRPGDVDKPAQWSRHEAVYAACRQRWPDARVGAVVDANLRHLLDRPDQLDRMVAQGLALEVDYGEADIRLLELGRGGARVISKDRFVEHRAPHLGGEWIQDNRETFYTWEGNLHREVTLVPHVMGHCEADEIRRAMLNNRVKAGGRNNAPVSVNYRCQEPSCIYFGAQALPAQVRPRLRKREGQPRPFCPQCHSPLLELAPTPRPASPGPAATPRKPEATQVASHPSIRLYLSGAGGRRHLDLTADRELLLGRGQEERHGVDLSDLNPDSADLLSRRHLRVRLVKDRPVIRDCGSTNGSWLHRRRLEPQRDYPLAPGDTVWLARDVVGLSWTPVAPASGTDEPASLPSPSRRSEVF